MAVYTISVNGADPLPLDFYDIQNPRVTCLSMMADTLTFDAVVTDFTAEPPFEDGDVLVLYQGDTIIFVGDFRGLDPECDETGETMTYVALGPWDFLENLAYQQQWNFYEDPSDPDSELAAQFISEIVLGVNNVGAFINVGAVIQRIVDHAITNCAAPLQYAVFVEAAFQPTEKCTDITCAAAIKRSVARLPDIVSRVDYTTLDIHGNPLPTLHFGRRADLEVKNVTIPPRRFCTREQNPDFVSSVKLKPRYDLLIPSVVLRFLSAAAQFATGWNTIAVQKAPDDATGLEYNALVATVRLIAGKAPVNIEQKVVVGPIEDSLAFAKVHFPELLNIPEGGGGFFLTDLSVLAVDVRTLDPDDTLDTTCTAEIIEGTITPWMQSNYGVHSQKQVVRMQLQATDNRSGKTFKKIFGPVQIMATNATTQTYRYLAQSLDGYVPPEPVPTGLAAAMYAAVSTLEWAGQITLEGDDCAGGIKIGQVLNLSGGRDAWLDAKAIVQEVEMDLTNGKTVVRIGPPDHLSIQDLLDRMHPNRDREIADNLQSLLTGSDSADTERQGLGVDHPAVAAHKDSYETSQQDPDSYSGDPSTIHEHADREVIVIDPDTGAVKRQMFHGTAAYTPAS